MVKPSIVLLNPPFGSGSGDYADLLALNSPKFSSICSAGNAPTSNLRIITSEREMETETETKTETETVAARLVWLSVGPVFRFPNAG